MSCDADVVPAVYEFIVYAAFSHKYCKVLVKNKRWQENGAPRVGELEHRTDSVDDGQERWAAEARESQ